MREKLLEICLERLKILDDCITNYDSYYLDAEMDMFSPIPTDHDECEAVGKFLEEVGASLDDYELIGIGQTFIRKGELLHLEELRPQDISLLEIL